jgi:hypothetical protein
VLLGSNAFPTYKGVPQLHYKLFNIVFLLVIVFPLKVIVDIGVAGCKDVGNPPKLKPPSL